MTELRLRPSEESRRTRATERVEPRPRPAGRLHRAVLRIDAATPPDRDRAIDVLRTLSILGVVLGHWLVSAVVLHTDNHLLGASPLQSMPALSPLTWVLQPLAVFFFVGGRVAAQGYATALRRGVRYRPWLVRRARRLARPTVPLLSLWALVLVGMAATGTAHETVHTLLNLVVSPLWFLLVFVVLTAATPLLHRHGIRIAVVAGAVVALLDLAHFAGGGTAWIERLRDVNILAGWLVPYCLGAAWSAGAFARRRSAVALLVGGALATAGLILWGGYPAAMVGVPGAELSNLNPVSLAAVTFGLAQCGGALLMCRPLRRAVAAPGQTSRPLADTPLRARPAQFLWAAVATLNLSAITVFLWHQTAMLAVTTLFLGLGDPLFGLHTSPGTPAWAAARCAWALVFAVALLMLCAAFRQVERDASARKDGIRALTNA
ncbi:acyltransferase [Streptomyces sp. CB02923]|uniref:acyltransferase family protein n=1 Tax=Streptomyces sp. CB02923 TaxID=1718985 RepID=UPI00093C237D|nr:acyltransferase [Streptomyces sp. CB02923]